jgi:tRNA nucleotidyltransferase (CCA-adding enzyme)
VTLIGIAGDASFDALGAAVAMRRLHPGALIRRFASDGALEAFVRVHGAALGIVDTPQAADLPAGSGGFCQSAVMVAVLADRGLAATALEATCLALGIHEATASLLDERTGEREVEALAWCLRHGARQGLLRGLLGGDGPPGSVGDVVRGAVTVIDHTTSIAEALRLCRSQRRSGVEVSRGGVLIGTAERDDLGRAVEHGLGGSPVQALVTTPPVIEVCEPLTTLLGVFAGGASRVAVFRPGTADARAVIDVVGVVTRADVVSALYRRVGPRPVTIDLAASVRQVAALAALEEPVGRCAGTDRVYLVGGAVRDVVLGSGEAIDCDLTVEGDGVAFARRLAAEVGGDVVVHDAFATATVRWGGASIDVVTARSEHYAHPGALPAVERATLDHDLGRRDFTVNAMAVSLCREDFGALFDPFGGRRDITERRLRVLHGLSFIEDPTRILRGVRYEIRLGFRFDRQAAQLARAAATLGLATTMSAARLRDALILVLREPRAGEALGRLAELAVLPAIHPGLLGDGATQTLIGRYDACVAVIAPDAPAWRGRLALAARRIAASSLAAWLAQLRLSRRDRQLVVTAASEAELIARRLSQAPDDAVLATRLLAPLAAEAMACVAAVDTAAGSVVEQYRSTWSNVQLEIDGVDLVRLHPAGPWVGQALAELREQKLRGQLGGRDEQLVAARALAARTGDQPECDEDDRKRDGDQRGGE